MHTFVAKQAMGFLPGNLGPGFLTSSEVYDRQQQTVSALQVGRWRSLIGSSAALGLMTLISVAIGSAFKSLPDVLKSSLPVGQYLGAALMLLFGVRTIKVP